MGSEKGSRESVWVAADEFNEDDDDQLWFDPWEGQIELSSHEVVGSKAQQSSDFILEEFDETSSFSSSSVGQHSVTRKTGSDLMMMQGSNFDNFHSAHTLFWNNQQRGAELEDVSASPRPLWSLKSRNLSKGPIQLVPFPF